MTFVRKNCVIDWKSVFILGTIVSDSSDCSLTGSVIEISSFVDSLFDLDFSSKIGVAPLTIVSSWEASDAVASFLRISGADTSLLFIGAGFVRYCLTFV